MIDKNLIGYSFEPVQLAVEVGRLKFVAKALGLTDPVYSDAEKAQAEGYSDLLAPPTFPFMLESDAFELDRLCDFFGQNVKRLLHAEQNFTYHQPICAGDQITFVKTIREIFEKNSRMRRPSSVLTGIFCRFGSVEARRPVFAPAME